MHLGQSSYHFRELQDRSASGDGHSQHFSQYGDADLKPDSCQKAGKYGLGEKVGDEAQFEQSRQQQKPRSEQCHRARERDISRAGCGR